MNTFWSTLVVSSPCLFWSSYKKLLLSCNRTTASVTMWWVSAVEQIHATIKYLNGWVRIQDFCEQAGDVPQTAVTLMPDHLSRSLTKHNVVYFSEKRPTGSVQEAQQHVLHRHELHSQHHQRLSHRHHLQQHRRADEELREQVCSRPQKNLQQRQQDRQDVPDSVPRPVRYLQSGLLGHVPQQGAGD